MWTYMLSGNSFNSTNIFYLSVFLLCFGALLSGFSQNTSYLILEAQPGDGVLAILRNYEINTACNKEAFFQLNDLNKKGLLMANKQYKLPIYIYTYNQKSIRSTLGISDRPLAEKIQAYNELMVSKSIKSGDYRKNKELWVPHHFLKCPEEQPKPILQASNSEALPSIEPATSGNLRGIYQIFGEKYSQVPLLSEKLRGCVYYIVSGHGGPDPGALGTYNKKRLCEDEYAYDISLRIARNLLSHGATAYLIIRDPNDGIRSEKILPCDKDELCWGEKPIPRHQKERLTQRAEEINRLFDKNKRQGVVFQRSIIIHVDSDSKRKSSDLYFYHQSDIDESFRLASILQRTIKHKYDTYQKGRGYRGTVKSRDLFMLREVQVPSVFIELGNIRNSNDQNRIVLASNRQYVANWLVDGILKDYQNR